MSESRVIKNNEYFHHLEGAVYNVRLSGFFWQEFFGRWGWRNSLFWKGYLFKKRRGGYVHE